MLHSIFLLVQPYLVGYVSRKISIKLAGSEIAYSALYSTVVSKSVIPIPFPKIFAIVWIVLYTLMGYTAARVKNTSPSLDSAQGLFYHQVQLVVNFAWCILFFGFQSPWLAFIDILLMIAAISLMMTKYKNVDKISYYLSFPYLIWVLFATYLNALVLI